MGDLFVSNETIRLGQILNKDIPSYLYTTVLTSELERLRKLDRRLAALEAGGVDNWEWYGESLSAIDEDD